MIEISHDAEETNAAVLFDERHRIGVRRQQDLLVPQCSVVRAGEIRDDRFAGVALETRAQREGRHFARFRIGLSLHLE